jgi:xanthine dehydrogenase accessory factor
MVQEIAEAVRRCEAEGKSALVARVVRLRGFSTAPVDDLVVVDSDGWQQGDLLGRPGAECLAAAASDMFGSDPEGATVRNLAIEIQDSDVEEIGLACGGIADVLLQSVAGIPPQLWSLLSERAPAALITRIEGPGAASTAIVVDRNGNSWGQLESRSDGSEALRSAAVKLLAAGRSETRRIEDESGAALIEAWVPHPRLAVVGSGEMVEALTAQAGLLGWETRSTDFSDEVDGLLDWGGVSTALVVLSHDPEVDTPALGAGLARGIAYIGAMGSRSTQSRRMERLASEGFTAAELEQIHRPIGLNLGGRRAPEVALSIVAEILACHLGRDARPLRETTGPIH